MADKKWYQKSFRRNLVDMHIEDWDEEFLSQFNPKQYFENMRKGQIQSPMIYIQSHVGYCYWPTESGHMHRAFNGRESTMRELFDYCHDAGMDVIAYYSLIFNNWAYNEHPDWRMIDSKGLSSRAGGNRYGICCPNNEGYRQFVSSQIKEFCDYFDFEGVFFDMTFWPMVCHCDCCKARWAREVGGDIPRIVDFSDEQWVKFHNKRSEWISEFAGFATAETKKIKPEATVVHNCSTINLNWQPGINQGNFLASDYTGGDISGGQSFACKLFYNTTQNQPFEYMTTLCYPGLDEHTTLKSQEMLFKSIMLSYAHHGAAFLIDAIDPRGTLDERVYERAGKVFRHAAQYEPYLLEGEHVEDVGVYYNFRMKADPDQAPFALGSPEEKENRQPHLVAVKGSANTLQENHIPYGIVNNWRLDLLEKLRVLILPDVPFMEAGEVEAVRSFVRKGGNLYLSGHSAPALVEEVFNCHFEGFTQENLTYMSPIGEGCQWLFEFSYERPNDHPVQAGFADWGIRGEVLATITLPYTMPPKYQATCFIVGGDRGNADFQNGLSDRFASIHSNPPGKYTNSPALLIGTYGKGKVVWSSAPLEAAKREQHRNVFAAIIHYLGGHFSFQSDAPAHVEIIMFDAPENRRLLISAVDIMDHFKSIETYNFKINVKLSTKPLKVSILPKGTVIPWQYLDGNVVIPVERLELFKMFSIEY